MSITWGTKKDGYVIGYEVGSYGVVTSATASVTVPINVYIQRDKSLSDSSNKLEWKGDWFADSSQSNINVSGIGQMLVKTINLTQALVYNAGQTKSFTLNFLNLGSKSVDLTVKGKAVIPARPFALPAAPTAFTATRINDGQNNLAWTNTSPGSASAPYENINVLRNDGSGWIQIAVLGSAVQAYQDKTVTVNKRYQYQVYASNSSGNGSGPTSTYIYTTPAAPNALSATRVGANAIISWSNRAGWADGIEVWHASNGVWDGAALTTLTPALTSYTHTGPSISTTHQYKLKAKVGALYAADALTNTLGVLAPPLAPTMTTGTTVFDGATQILMVTWLHNPSDGTAQQGADVQYREVGTSTWTHSYSATSSPSLLFGLGTFTNGKTYEFQVATKGQSGAGFGAFSASQVLKASAKPLVTVTAPSNLGTTPAGTTFTNSKLTVSWTYFDAEGSTQSMFRVQLWSGALLGEWSVGSYATNYELPYKLLDTTPYVIKVFVRDGDGIESVETTSSVAAITTAFPLPPQPSIIADYDDTMGYTSVELSIAPSSGTDAEYIQVLRSDASGDNWTVIADKIDVPSSEEDVARQNMFAYPTITTGATGYVFRSAGFNGITAGTNTAIRGSKQASLCNTSASYTDAGTYFYGLPTATTPSLGVDVQEGSTITISAYIQKDNVVPTTGIIARFHTGTAWVGGNVSGPTVTATSAWQRIYLTTTVPATATKMVFGVAAVGTVAFTVSQCLPWVSNVLIEKTDTVGDYFDGAYSPDALLTPLWDGAAEQSTSRLSGISHGEPTTVIDYIPPMNEFVWYKAIAWSALPTHNESDEAEVYTNNDKWIFVNGGNGFATHARLKGNPAVDLSLSREKVLHQFAGRSKPVEFIGESQNRVYKVSGDVDGFGNGSELGTFDSFEDVASLPAPVVYRDPMGRRIFGSIGEVGIKHSGKSDLAGIDFTITEVDYDE